MQDFSVPAFPWLAVHKLDYVTETGDCIARNRTSKMRRNSIDATRGLVTN